jgi:hypothetical protein
MMNRAEGDYYAYLIRLRRYGTPSMWRVSLQDVHGEMLLQFDGIADLVAFLHAVFSCEEDKKRLSASNDSE